jgi:hypothetical protein
MAVIQVTKVEAVYGAWLVYPDSGAINKWWIEN